MTKFIFTNAMFWSYIVNLRTIANLRPISTKAKTMDTYEAITYSLYTNTKDLSYKNGNI